MLSENHKQTEPKIPELPKAALLDLPITLTDYSDLTSTIDQIVARQGRAYICVAAVHSVMLAREHSDFRDAMLGASYVVPDGQPLVWALKALGHNIQQRVYGPQLMDHYCAHAARTGKRIFLYGGRDQNTLDRLIENLQTKHPGLNIVGSYLPPFHPLSDEDEGELIELINSSRADVLWVGIGVPKQELWMARMRSLLNTPLLIGVGAAFDFHAGTTRQAPSWMQKHGLEWLYRLSQEPRRLLGRYLRYNPRFVIRALQQVLQERRTDNRNG